MSAMSVNNQQSTSFVDNVNEVVERQNRKCNLMTFGVVEPPPTSLTNIQATDEDANVTKDILKQIFPN